MKLQVVNGQLCYVYDGVTARLRESLGILEHRMQEPLREEDVLAFVESLSDTQRIALHCFGYLVAHRFAVPLDDWQTLPREVLALLPVTSVN